MKNIISFKYSRFNKDWTKLTDKLDAAAERIKTGIGVGDYFPKIILETMYDMKVKLENTVMEPSIETSNRYLHELNSISDRLIQQLNQPPKNTEAASRNLELIW